MKRVLSVLLLAFFSLSLLSGCRRNKGTIETDGKKYISANGGGCVYVFNVDDFCKQINRKHANLITIYNYKGTSKDSIHFTDFYIDENGDYNGQVKISKPNGFSGFKDGVYISNNTKIKVNDRNCYINCGRKVYLNNLEVTLIKVPQEENQKGTASITFTLST